MLKTRVIPCLLLKGRGLVKTLKFKNSKYIGDPINAVKIFNDKEVDELIFLDITATKEKRPPRYELIKDIASECFMPFSYGGGIKNVEQVRKLLKLGAEKVVINSAVLNDELIKQTTEIFGNQSLIVSLDVKKNRFGKYQCFIHSGTKNLKQDPVELCKRVEKLGAGELFVNSINNDGMMNGYDLKLLKSISENVEIPVIACGGAGSIKDFEKAVTLSGVSAVSAGSMFVFHGPHKAVLINYPSYDKLKYL